MDPDMIDGAKPGQTIENFLDEGTYIKNGGVIKDWEFWSRYQLTASTQEIILFSTKQGDPSSPRIDQTNLPIGGQMANSQKQVIHYIAAQYIPGALKSTTEYIALLRWLSTTILQLRIQDKSASYQFRLSRLMGIKIPAVISNAAANVIMQTISDRATPVFNLRRKITISASSPFTVSLFPGVAGTAAQVADLDFLDIGHGGDLWTRM